MRPVKYIKRIPTGNKKRPYIYIYSEKKNENEKIEEKPLPELNDVLENGNFNQLPRDKQNEVLRQAHILHTNIVNKLIYQGVIPKKDKKDFVIYGDYIAYKTIFSADKKINFSSYYTRIKQRILDKNYDINYKQYGININIYRFFYQFKNGKQLRKDIEKMLKKGEDYKTMIKKLKEKYKDDKYIMSRVPLRRNKDTFWKDVIETYKIIYHKETDNPPDFYSDNNNTVEDDAQKQLKQIINQLPEIEQKIINHAYGLGNNDLLSKQDIAEKIVKPYMKKKGKELSNSQALNLTYFYISKIIKKIKKKLSVNTLKSLIKLDLLYYFYLQKNNKIIKHIKQLNWEAVRNKCLELEMEFYNGKNSNRA